jgi:hypothetical protein
MHHDLLRDVEFWRFLLSIDQESIEAARQEGCSCGARRHSANYPRKPRGAPVDLPEDCRRQLSLCCDRDGCRKRVTPPSARFLGPKVYLLPVIFLAAAMRQGSSPRAMRDLSATFGADRRTIARWQVLWCEHFPNTRFWKVERAGFVPALNVATLPHSLLKAFFISDDLRGDWERLLRFLSPITIAGGLAVAISR